MHVIIKAALVDSNYMTLFVRRFLNVSCCAPGSAHDATALKMSTLYKNSDRLLPQGDRLFEGKAVPFMLLADPAYPHWPWILKGYTGSLSREEESFNVYHSTARNVVEQAFGRLKGRWRVLLKRTDINYKFVPTVALAACALHNFCELHFEVYSDSWAGVVSNSEQLAYPQPTSRPQRSGTQSELRDCLKNYLAKTFPMRSSSFH